MDAVGPWGVVVVDRRPVLRAGIEHAIQGVDGLSLWSAVDSLHPALDAVRQRRPRLVVLPEGLASCQREVIAQAGASGCGVVFYDEVVQASRAIDAVAAGARGYASWMAPSEVFGAVVRRAAAGEVALCPMAQDAVAQVALKGGLAVRLTAREREVMRMLAAGLSVAGIAAALVVSENTVKSHKRTLYVKLGAVNGASLVVNAVGLGLLDLPLV